jgi:hypothetical protein
MRPYVVRQGDSCATLSIRYGFDMDTVWNDPANDDLRNLRQDPHVLAPLDVLYIPDDGEATGITLTTGATNNFVADVPVLYGQVVCIGPDDQPLAGAAFTIPELSPPFEGTTKPDGTADFEFPYTLQAVSLVFTDPAVVVVAYRAQLDPVNTPSGARQRLEALGVVPPMPVVPDPDARAMLAEYVAIAALQKFQNDQGIEPTGELDDATVDALQKAYGA